MDRRASLRRLLESYPGSRVLPEHAIKEYLREAGLPSPRGCYIAAGAPLPGLACYAYPLVAKVFSANIRSKSDAGGIRLGLRSPEEALTAVGDLMSIPGAEGVLLEEQAAPGTEVIVGGIIDPQFGPVVMFGLGGVLVELFHDVAFSLAPMTRDDAFRLMERVKGYRLLSGYRGKPPCDRETLADILIMVSELMATGLLEEIDLNPVVLYPRSANILDAKILIPSPSADL
jgi:acetate---CoA ligase (ADP-forming) subunit beta